jgi:hypothetical protein
VLQPETEAIAVRPAKASRLLDVSERVVWKWVREGRLDVSRPSAGITLIMMQSIRRLLSE